MDLSEKIFLKQVSIDFDLVVCEIFFVGMLRFNLSVCSVFFLLQL